MTNEQINRILVGTLAGGSLAGGAALYLSGSPQEMLTASLIRLGLLLGALWLALPSKGRSAAWANVKPWWILATAGALFYIVRFPRTLLPLVLFAGAALGALRLLSGKRR